jgi:hypothetical protein
MHRESLMLPPEKREAVVKTVRPPRPARKIPNIEQWASCPLPTDDPEFASLSNALKTVQLKPAVDAFVKNIDEVVALTHVVDDVFNAGQQDEHVKVAACTELLAELIRNRSPSGAWPGDVHERIATLYKQLLDGTAKPQVPSAIAYSPGSAFESLNDELNSSIALLMSQQLVAAWTAFEALAGDLWEAAVNAHPRGLSELRGRGKTKEAGPTGPKTQVDEEGGSIPIRRLQEYNYNVRGVMGTLLKAGNKVRFTTLEEIRDAYTRAFSEHSETIDRALQDASLDALAVARNLLVHKAGVCDSEYHRRVKGGKLSPLPKLEIGQPLDLDGVMVKELLSPVFACGSRLTKAVDGWLAGHPEKERMQE